MSDSLPPPGSSVHQILQAKILKWVAIPFSRGSSQSRDQTQVSDITADSLLSEPTWKTLDHHKKYNNNGNLKYCENHQNVTKTGNEQRQLAKLG